MITHIYAAIILNNPKAFFIIYNLIDYNKLRVEKKGYYYPMYMMNHAYNAALNNIVITIINVKSSFFIAFIFIYYYF